MANYAGTKVGSGINAILSVGLEETTYGTIAAAEMWSSLVDELRISREDQIYRQVGIRNMRSLQLNAASSFHTNMASRYPVSIRGKVDSGVPFAMAGGYISATSDPTISIFRGLTHTTPTKVYMPSWSIKRSFDDESDNLSILGVVFDSGTFSCDLDGPWTFDLKGVGKSQGTTAASGVTIPATMLGSWNTTVTIDENANAWASGTDGTIYGLRNIAFTLNNNNRIRNEFGTSAPVAIRQPKSGMCDVELKLTRGHIDSDLWTRIADGAVNSFQVATTDGTTTVTNTFDDCFAKTTEHPVNNEDETIETITLDVGNWYCVAADSVTYVSWD